jgi:peptidyl-prolyl cis-trans isomerase C
MAASDAARRERCRRRLRSFAGRACGVVALSIALTELAAADAAPLARVGTFAIDAASFRERAARVARLEWPALGATWPERRRRFLDDVLIPEALVALAAAREPPGLPPARDLALARALAATIVDEASRVVASEEEVLAYSARYPGQLGAPRALTLWRILLTTEADARAVIAQLAPPTLAAFSRLARERSIDRATHMRAGNLGQVGADGQTRVPELRVAPALFEAADRVRDGELVPEPVREGDAFAVVWRRASHAARAPAGVDVARLIQARLAEERAASVRRELLESLRRAHLRDYHPERAAAYEPRFDEPGVPPRRIGTVDGAPRPRLLPELTDRGLR